MATFSFNARTQYVRNNPALQRWPNSQRQWSDYMKNLNSVIHEGRSGTFTPTWSGFSSDPSGGRVYWAQSGAIVTLAFETLGLGTSNLTTFQITNLPDDLNPKVSQIVALNGVVDNNVGSWGTAIVGAGAVAFAFEDTEPASWTGSGSKGFDQGSGASPSISYNVILNT